MWGPTNKQTTSRASYFTVFGGCTGDDWSEEEVKERMRERENRIDLQYVVDRSSNPAIVNKKRKINQGNKVSIQYHSSFMVNYHSLQGNYKLGVANREGCSYMFLLYCNYFVKDHQTDTTHQTQAESTLTCRQTLPSLPPCLHSRAQPHRAVLHRTSPAL